MNKTHTGQSVHYTIRIEGKVDSRWSEWFNGMEIVVEDETHPVTTLSGPVIDQARLRAF